MKRGKHDFLCTLCHSPCKIYKKGRNHRVLVCPQCGVLATNGLKEFFSKEAYAKRRSSKLGKALQPIETIAEKGVGFIPYVGQELQSKISSDTRGTSITPRLPRVHTHDITKGERYVLLALGKEA